MRYTEKYEITCHDADKNNNIRPSVLLRYLQETANHQMRDRKPSYYDLFFEGKAFVVTRLSVQIYKQLHQYEHIEIDTWRCPDKGATFPRCYVVRRGDEIAARGYSEWAVVNHKTGRLWRSNEIDITGYEMDEPLDLDIPKKYRFPKDLEFEKVGDHHVFYSDTDMNGHMTNSNYPDMVWNYIPDVTEKEVTSVNIRFMKEAPMDSDLEIFMAKPELALSGDPMAEDLFGFKSIINGKTNIECLMGVRPVQERIYY